MYVTVREALGLGPLQKATVIAGEAGLDRVIRSVTVMDTPEIELWLQGGELLLTNAYVLKDDRAQLIPLLERVNAKGAAAVGIKVRQFLRESLPELVDKGNELGLPILAVPVEHPWVDIINPLLGEIIDRHVRLLEHAVEVHRRLADTVLGGGGLERIAEHLARLTCSPVMILNADLEPLASTGGGPPRPEVLDAIRQALGAGADAASGLTAGKTVFLEEGTGGRVAVVQMAAGGDVYGYVVVREANHTLGDLDVVALEQGAIACALEILRQRTVKEVERRYRDTFLFDVLSGTITDRDLALARARALGWDLDRQYLVSVVALDEPGEWPRGGRGRAEELRHAVLGALRSLPGVIWLERSDGLVLCLPCPSPEHLSVKQPRRARAVGEKIRQAADRLGAGSKVTVGMGRCAQDVTGLSGSYREASLAVNLGRKLWGGDRVILFDDLGFYRIMAQYPLEGAEIDSFCRETLGALQDHDRRHNSDLLRTLEVYLDSAGSWAKAAEALSVHPNTLGYRLSRVEQLLGVDLASPEQRLNLQLALRILRLRGRFPAGGG